LPPTINISKGSAAAAALPTGITFNNTNGFRIGSQNVKATYVIVGEDGGISAWSPSADFNNALLEVDNSAAGAVYKGVAIARAGGKPFLYAANFHYNRI